MLTWGLATLEAPETPTPFIAVHVKSVFEVFAVRLMLTCPPLHTVSLLTNVYAATGVGLTVIEYCAVVPGQRADPAVVGVTLSGIVIGFNVVFTRLVKAGIFPVPLVVTKLLMPDGTVACQLKVTPGVVEVTLTCVVFAPLQMVWFACENCTDGAGLIAMVYCPKVPLHPFADGVTL